MYLYDSNGLLKYTFLRIIVLKSLFFYIYDLHNMWIIKAWEKNEVEGLERVPRVKCTLHAVNLGLILGIWSPGPARNIPDCRARSINNKKKTHTKNEVEINENPYAGSPL